jgi:hypothetical protein
MPRILTHCPTDGALVPTGHRTPEIDLSTLAGARAFRCPGCGQVHTWSAEDATVETTLSLPVFRSAA